MQLVMWRVKRGIFWVNGMECDLKNLEEDWSREEEAGQGQIFPDLLGPAQTLDLHLETTPEKSLFQFPFFPCHIFWQFYKVNGHYRCTPFVSKTIARLVIQSCLALCNPMDCSLPGSSVHGEFSRQEYWSGLPYSPPGDLPNPGTEPRSPTGGFFTI